MKRITIISLRLAIVTLIAAMIWFDSKTCDDSISIIQDEKINPTPTMVEQMRMIGQWEFLCINDEEIVDTIRKGIFTDDELVRIYYGTLRLGIDFADCSPDWIRQSDDTITVTLPKVKLLDERFIDEARCRSFFENGKWSNADRKSLYNRARKKMTDRCLTPENIATANANAKEQVARMLQPIALPNTLIVKNEESHPVR